jgi:micrococcal nuclease
MKPDNLYQYRATMVSAYDGDTVTLDVDVGFEVRHRIRCRLYGIDTPELRGIERPEGLAARDWLRERLPVGTELTLRTIRDRTGKYGRYLAELWHNGENINQELIEAGHAVPYLP